MSVVVQFDPYAKTGNRMFQVAFAKILANKKNCSFFSPPIPGFSNTYIPTLSAQSVTETIDTLHYGAQIVDMNELLTTNKTVVVNSFLQKYTYYVDHMDILQHLFKIDSDIEVDKDELVIHIRGTDYKAGNVHINDTIYLDILDKISPAKASLVTDDINTDIVKQLCNRGVRLVTKTNVTNKGNGLNEFEMLDFAYMLKSNLLLISQSTFSWWAAFLGQQKQVFVPYDNNKDGMWKLHPQKDDIDLIYNDPKFYKIVYERN